MAPTLLDTEQAWILQSQAKKRPFTFQMYLHLFPEITMQGWIGPEMLPWSLSSQQNIDWTKWWNMKNYIH